MAETLDAFLPGVTTQDTRKRLQVHTDLVAYLHDPANSTACEELDRFIDGLSSWINSSNYKVCVPEKRGVMWMVSMSGTRLTTQFCVTCDHVLFNGAHKEFHLPWKSDALKTPAPSPKWHKFKPSRAADALL